MGRDARSPIGRSSAISQFVCNSSGPSVLRATPAVSTKSAKFHLPKLRHEIAETQPATRSKCRLASGPRTSKRRREHAKYSRRRLRLTATLCQRSRERKPDDAIDPPPFRCRLVCPMRIRDVLRIPRTSYRCYAAKYRHRWRLHVGILPVTRLANVNYSSNGIGTCMRNLNRLSVSCEMN